MVTHPYLKYIVNEIQKDTYHTRAIISRGLYIFYPIFHCGLYCRAVSITDILCTKQGNSSFLDLQSAVYN